MPCGGVRVQRAGGRRRGKAEAGTACCLVSYSLLGDLEGVQELGSFGVSVLSITFSLQRAFRCFVLCLVVPFDASSNSPIVVLPPYGVVSLSTDSFLSASAWKPSCARCQLRSECEEGPNCFAFPQACSRTGACSRVNAVFRAAKYGQHPLRRDLKSGPSRLKVSRLRYQLNHWSEWMPNITRK